MAFTTILSRQNVSSCCTCFNLLSQSQLHMQSANIDSSLCVSCISRRSLISLDRPRKLAHRESNGVLAHNFAKRSSRTSVINGQI